MPSINHKNPNLIIMHLKSKLEKKLVEIVAIFFQMFFGIEEIKNLVTPR